MHPVIALPGMNCSAALWADCDLGDVTYVELTLSSIHAQVDHLLATLPERFVLLGLSLGGIVAMALAARAPQRLAGLCVMSCNAKAPTEAQQQAWATTLNDLDAGLTPRAFQQSILSLLLSTDHQTPDAAERALAMADSTGSDVLAAQLRMQQSRIDLRPGLRDLSVPTLIVSGTHDALCPPAFHTEIAEAIGARAELHSIEAGHLLPMEAPAEFSSVFATWRSRHNL